MMTAPADDPLGVVFEVFARHDCRVIGPDGKSLLRSGNGPVRSALTLALLRAFYPPPVEVDAAGRLVSDDGADR